MTAGKHVSLSQLMQRTTHERWAKADQDDRNWPSQMCYNCRFYFRFSQPFPEWGACTNPLSSHDGTSRFRCAGCEVHELDERYLHPPDSPEGQVD